MMYYLLFLAASLLSCCARKISVHSPPETVRAFVGGHVILPCSFKFTASHDFPTVEWSKEGLQPNVVFLYRDGCETHEMKNPAFEYRTNLIMREVKNGNISLRISNVRLSDVGRYQCMRLWKKTPRDITTVELVVDAVSEPKLSVVSAESGEVTLQCEATCWLPRPQIEFLDDRGNNTPANQPKRHQDVSGCYTVTQRVTLQRAAKSVTCRVRLPEINLTRDTEILIPVDYMRSCFLTTSGAIIYLLLVLNVLAVMFLKRCCDPVKRQTPKTRKFSGQSAASGTSDQPLHVRVESDGQRGRQHN